MERVSLIGRWGSALTTLTTLALVTSLERVADACSYVSCSTPPAVSPPETKRLPANAPAFVVHAPDYDMADLVLRGPGGATVPTKVVREATEALVIPLAPLVGGAEYVVEPTVACTAPNVTDRAPKTSQAIVKTGPNADLPVAIGSIFVESARALDEGEYESANVKLDPTPELAAYLPVTRIRVTVDGIPLREYGPDVDPYGTGVGSFLIECPSPKAGRSGGCDSLRVLAGTHVVELSAHVAGATVDPAPVSTTFTLRCRSTPEPDVDIEGTLSADAIVPRESGCACTTATRSRFAPSSAFALVVVALAITRRAMRPTV